MNEKFADMDEKLETLEADMNERFEQLSSEMNERFERVDQRFERMDQRFERMEKEFNGFRNEQKNFLRCREHEEIKPVGVLLPDRGYVFPPGYPTFVRDFLKLASDEKGIRFFNVPSLFINSCLLAMGTVSSLAALLAFYSTKGYEDWGEAEDSPHSSEDDDDLEKPLTRPFSLQDAVRRYREIAMRTLASHLGLNFDEIMRLRRHRVARNRSREQSKASKRQAVAFSSGDKRQRLSKFENRSEIPDSKESSESMSTRRLPYRLGARSTAEASTTRSGSHRSSRQQGCDQGEGHGANDDHSQVISGASSEEMA